VTDPVINPLSLRTLQLFALVKAYMRFRNPHRREAGRHREAFYQSMWRDAARTLGATCGSLGGGICDISLNGVSTRVADNTCAIDDPVTLALLSDKELTYQILEDEGVPTPPRARFSIKQMAPGIEFLKRAGSDCVIKPGRGTGGGRGVTTGIRTPFQLARATAAAAVYCDELLIEKQIPGDNYRLLYLDGHLLDAIVRRPPSVTGDGKSNIGRLFRRANQERLQNGSAISQELLTIDLDMKRTLARQGLALRSVPRAGEPIILKTVINQNCGADNSTATALLCPSVIEDGARAVRALGVRLAGVDIITPDPTKPLAEAGGVILEVNAPPNYYNHYHKRDGAFPLAVHVLRRLLVERLVERLDSQADVIQEPVG
jgi:cyanophycin synthetase